MSVQIIPIPGLPEVRPGDDVAALVLDAAGRAGVDVRDGDVLAVTQKIVSKAEGRVVAEVDGPGKAGWVERETRRVVARRDDLVVAETRHGFVCANAGVDASNVAEGFLTLLPQDPDLSASRIRAVVGERTGVDVGVVVTDTFGRPWRNGLVNVAIGCAGLPAVVDLRGTTDAGGHVLEASIQALADEVAAASGLAMGKADGIPVAVIRGVRAPVWAPDQPASSLVRPPEMDLFRESPLQAIHARRSIRRFGPGEVDRGRIEEAVRAACAAPGPHHTPPWLFVVLWQGTARKRLLAAMADAWTDEMRGNGAPDGVIEERLRRSNTLLGEAPVMIVPFVRRRGSRVDRDAGRAERSDARRDALLLSAGAAIQSLVLALHAQDVASCWTPSTLFCKEETREALGLPDGWTPLGSVVAGPPPGGWEPPGTPPDVEHFVRFLD
jgi:coenzyme F420-0:L-glutamate ligase/coenzyme F420-1:gamma-L-glutamate ligase